MLLAGVPAACSLDVRPLTQLQSLSMVRCSLTAVPAGVCSCARLRQLDLSSNSILEVRQILTSKILSLWHYTIHICTRQDLAYLEHQTCSCGSGCAWGACRCASGCS